MALPFVPSDAGLLALQAGIVAAPRAIARIRAFERLRGRGWALVPIGSIVVVIFAIRYVSDTATGLTYLALIAVPLLAAVALGWAMRGAVPLLALAAVPLFVLAWLAHHSLVGEASAAILSALSCVTLGVLLAAVTPPTLAEARDRGDGRGRRVAGGLRSAPVAERDARRRAPGGGLPQLQTEIFGTVTMGYGDLFVAAVLGAVLASDPRLQRRAALLTFVIAALFDLLFFVVDELPATVPVALALIAVELQQRFSAGRRRSTPAAAIPRPAT